MAGTEAARDDPREQEYRKAMNSATRMLSRRQHAVRELRTKLIARFDEETVDRVIARLQELGFLNDLEFAREYARQRFDRSPRSALSVTVELEGGRRTEVRADELGKGPAREKEEKEKPDQRPPRRQRQKKEASAREEEQKKAPGRGFGRRGGRRGKRPDGKKQKRT